MYLKNTFLNPQFFTVFQEWYKISLKVRKKITAGVCPQGAKNSERAYCLRNDAFFNEQYIKKIV